MKRLSDYTVTAISSGVKESIGDSELDNSTSYTGHNSLLNAAHFYRTEGFKCDLFPPQEQHGRTRLIFLSDVGKR